MFLKNIGVCVINKRPGGTDAPHISHPQDIQVRFVSGCGPDSLLSRVSIAEAPVSFREMAT